MQIWKGFEVYYIEGTDKFVEQVIANKIEEDSHDTERFRDNVDYLRTI